MAKQQRTIDIWLLDSNTIYRDVPFNVATDWIQQGRLLPEDKVRVTGKDTWHELAKIPAFQPFFPKPEPQQVEDQAELLAPVESEFQWKRRGDPEEDDPDMIPLIDVSLVLLIFFMMTTSQVSEILSPINTPRAEHQLATLNQGMFWVGIDAKNKLGNVQKRDGWPVPWYTVGADGVQDKAFTPIAEKQASLSPVLTSLQKVWSKSAWAGKTIRVRIRADRTLANEVIDDTIEAIQRLAHAENGINKGRTDKQRITLRISAEVSAPKK